MLEHLVQVRFSPLMTLPTTVKITAQDFETRLAWSALPGSIISVPAGQAMNHLFFPKRRSVAGFFRRLLAYTISCISISIIPHILFQYASLQYYRFNTYPFNMHPVHAYPFNTYPFNTYASAGMAMNVNAKHILASYASAGMASFCLCRPKAKYIFTTNFSMSFLLSLSIRSILSHRTCLSL